MDKDLQLSQEELQVYEVIKRETKTSGGIKQTQVRKHPELKNLDPKKITQIIKKLVRMNLIKRTLVDEKGKRSYILTAKGDSSQSTSTTLNETGLSTAVNANTTIMTEIYVDLLDIPCMKCKHVFECGTGRSYDPLRCPIITYFILEKSGIVSSNKVSKV